MLSGDVLILIYSNRWPDSWGLLEESPNHLIDSDFDDTEWKIESSEDEGEALIESLRKEIEVIVEHELEISFLKNFELKKLAKQCSPQINGKRKTVDLDILDAPRGRRNKNTASCLIALSI